MIFSSKSSDFFLLRVQMIFSSKSSDDFFF